MPEPLLKVENLTKYFKIPAGAVHAVDDVSFHIYKGETLGLVGESGCGKSTTGRVLVSLIEATGGRVTFDGRDILSLKKNDLHEMRRHMQLIFQDPFSSLDPRKSIGSSIAKPLEIYRTGDRKEREKRVDELMEQVELSPRLFNKYPHELDGGSRQRVGIARALALSPKFIVCDEPVSALDVSIQAQIINLLQELQKMLGLTFLFVSHDLSVVKYISDDIAVMYLGKIVEIAKSDDIFASPSHPYTQALLNAVPIPELRSKTRKRVILTGGVPSPLNPPPGCRFHTRCPYKTDRCAAEEPMLTPIAPDHKVACFGIK
ncbi:MAG: ABC transporter ATP-binding protein [Synergistaceae bacterium]|jgi:oligopeptide/dipeptide ABC transporter ATP-binding protein|nr:ABC transporter ATP-binding protein [Synergistaceae bacterium]